MIRETLESKQVSIYNPQIMAGYPMKGMYLKNAYRVLLTRARQGMVIVVPEGDPSDPTRKPEMYDETYEYLRGLGAEVVG